MIDRSQFMEELRRNPELMHRIAVITAGEVSGSAPLEKRILQAETIFNRAMARGITLEQATRQVGSNPDGKQGGYYPRDTFVNGEKSLARAGGDAKFYEQVLKPVLAGSDVGTKTLGFAPTGNASEGTNNFASKRAAAGVYSQYKWHPDGKEMYVQQRPDDNSRIDAKRSDAPPRPPADIPNVAATGTAPQGPPGPQASGQPDILAPVGQPGDPRRAPLYSGPATAAAAPAPAPAARQGGGLGGAMRSLFGGGTGSTGTAQPGRSTYVDPSTGHTIQNPGGSGEQAMGLTRDLGARPALPLAPRGTPAARSPPAAAAPAPTPLPQPRPNIAPEGMQPPLTTTNTAVPDIVAPQLRTDPRRLSPFEINPNMQVPPPESAPVAQNPAAPPFDELGVQRETSMARPGEPVSVAQLLGLSATGTPSPPPPMPPMPPMPAAGSLTGLPNQNAMAADKALNLTPQERDLYDRHLRNLYGSGGVDNPDGQRSSLLQGTATRGDRTYNIPTVWDGKVLPGPEAMTRANAIGLDKFPSYGSPDEANKRYGAMHDFMEKDTTAFEGTRPARGASLAPFAFTDKPMDLQRPFGDFKPAPEAARGMAEPNAEPWRLPPPSPANASAAFSGGGMGLTLSPFMPPKTVDQQLRQEEPLQAPQPRPGPAGFPQVSQGLSPFEQWMWPQGGGWGDSFGFGGGGGGGWDMANFY